MWPAFSTAWGGRSKAHRASSVSAPSSESQAEIEQMWTALQCAEKRCSTCIYAAFSGSPVLLGGPRSRSFRESLGSELGRSDCGRFEAVLGAINGRGLRFAEVTGQR